MSTTPETPITPPMRPRPSAWVRLLCLVGGIGLLVIGVLGLILPVLPGWIFIIPGIALVSTVTPKVRQFLRAVRNRIPRRLALVRAFFHRLQAFAKRKKR